MKQTLLIFLLFWLVKPSFAQKPTLTGHWLLVSIETKAKKMNPYYQVEFKNNGKMAMRNYEIADWKLENDKLILQSNVDKKLNGTCDILTFKNDKFVYKKEGEIFRFERYDPEEVRKNKIYQNIVGVWKIFGTATTVLKFDTGGSFTELVSDQSGTVTSKATWLYVPKQKLIIIKGDVDVLQGVSKLVSQTETLMVVKNNKVNYTLDKSPKVKDVSHLEFTYDEIAENESDISALPWNDELLYNFLPNISSIYYNKATYEPEVSAFLYQNLKSDVEVDLQTPKIVFNNYQLVDEEAIMTSKTVKANLQNAFNPFFPQKPLAPYRVKDWNKILKMDDQDYNCTVVEGFDGDDKVTYWMLNDYPGIYAKIINENDGDFGLPHYIMYELQHIENKKSE